MSVLCEYAVAAYFTYCHIFHTFQQSAHIAFFPHKLVYLMAILIFIAFLFELVFVVIRKCWTGWLQLGLRWRRQVQPAPIVLVHFQGWANHVTTADRVNTHGYHNHVCSGVSCGYTYNVRFMQICNCSIFLLHNRCLYGLHI